MHDRHYNAYKIGLLTQSARADVLQLEDDDGDDDDGNDSWPLEIGLYSKKVALCHRLRTWMVESSIPARAAEIAALILKQWPSVTLG